ncbi:MAG: HAMP domain-containing histidine kinase [Eggerthellaceae bacterium]|nr:HAMP domain-containing histidine kinase [Eggerthellaceae bacterium]
MTDPLRSLRKKISTYRAGNTSVPFEAEGRLYEADVLAEDFKDLLDSSAAQCADLARREKQQMQFVGDVAHELRTPLTAIRGNAELLKDEDMPQEMREKFCDTIMNEAERLSRLTNDLLSLQHIEGDKSELSAKRLNLKDVVTEALDALAPVLEAVDAQVKVTGEAPDVLGNEDRLQEVVSNLVDNATHFIDPGGHITIELYGISGNSVIAVKDDGPGFGDVDPAMLFERFFRTDFSRARNTGGSGLGLAIVKSIVEAHDGTVEAYNLPEGGACFIVAIPSVA